MVLSYLFANKELYININIIWFLLLSPLFPCFTTVFNVFSSLSLFETPLIHFCFNLPLFLFIYIKKILILNHPFIIHLFSPFFLIFHLANPIFPHFQIIYSKITKNNRLKKSREEKYQQETGIKKCLLKSKSELE